MDCPPRVKAACNESLKSRDRVVAGHVTRDPSFPRIVEKKPLWCPFNVQKERAFLERVMARAEPDGLEPPK